MDKRAIAERNIRLQGWVNMLAGVTFLVPVITLFYTYTGLSMFEIVIVSNVMTFFVWMLEIPTSVFADTTGRTKSLKKSVLCNLLGAIIILLFPSMIGFIVASIFGALYWSFWSGTGQAFLSENLAILKREKEFGRVIGHYMFLEQLCQLYGPILASVLLLRFGDPAFYALAILDIFAAAVLVAFTFQLKEVSATAQFKSFSSLLKENVRTARLALKDVVSNSRLRLLMLYRSLSNHVAFLPLLILPILTESGMPTWYAGGVTAAAALATMITSKYTYLIGERWNYRGTWIFGTILQGILLIAAGLLFQHWLPLILIYLAFCLGEGIWQPSWNHVLVEETSGNAVATVRSIVFSVFALYTTIGKQILAAFPIHYALIGLGIFILVINGLFAHRVLKQK